MVTLLLQTASAGIMKPRKDCKIITTEHFDILYSQESSQAAYLIAQHCENFFYNSLNFFPNKHYLRIMVIISADSDLTQCEYTPFPYNRIIVYQGIIEEGFEENLLSLFNQEVIEAVAKNTRNKFWEVLSQSLIGDFLQPVTLLNIPEGFIQGYIGSVQNQIMKVNSCNPKSEIESLQIIARAKKENRLPSLQQLSGAFDLYEHENLSSLVTESFCFFIQSVYGLEKFSNYWKQCGELNFFRLNEGIFKKVYGVSLNQVWDSYVASIPEPDFQEETDRDILKSIIKDSDTEFEHILKIKDGYIWFNPLKAQVESINLLEETEENIVFFSDNINKLSITENEKYIIVHRTQRKSQKNFQDRVVQIFDLERKAFMKETFYEKNGTVIVDDDGTIIQIDAVLPLNQQPDFFRSFIIEKKYNPLKYLFGFSWNMFMPIKEISVKEGAINWLGLGFKMESKSDPMSNHIFGLSASAGFLQHEIIQYLSPTNFTISFFQNEYENFKFNYAFSAYYENTATPINFDIITHFRFTPKGEYNLTGYGRAFYSFPTKMDFRNFTIDLKSLYEFSTTYLDINQSDTFPNLGSWVSLKDSYQDLQANISLEFSSSRIYGHSAYKRTGLTIGIGLFTIWNITVKKIYFENKKIKDANQNLEEDFSFTQAIYDQMWNGIFAPSQINLGLYAKLELPNTLPLKDNNGWIFSMPVSMYLDLFNTKGISFQVDTKVLLVGKELQKGFRPINFYINRFGFFGGYKFILSYDENKTGIPDLREFERYKYIFNDNYVNDWFYFEFDVQYTITMGILCDYLIGTGFVFEKSIRTEDFEFKINFKFTEK